MWPSSNELTVLHIFQRLRSVLCCYTSVVRGANRQQMALWCKIDTNGLSNKKEMLHSIVNTTKYSNLCRLEFNWLCIVFTADFYQETLWTVYFERTQTPLQCTKCILRGMWVQFHTYSTSNYYYYFCISTYNLVFFYFLQIYLCICDTKWHTVLYDSVVFVFKNRRESYIIHLS